jgi:tetratricopeptide (TPR) repeat protein
VTTPPGNEAICPDEAVACLNRARECLHDRNFDAAELLLRQAIAQDPKLALAYELLGKLLYRDARAQESAAVYRAWLEALPADPIAAHLVAATGGAAAPERASDIKPPSWSSRVRLPCSIRLRWAWISWTLVVELACVVIGFAHSPGDSWV